MGQDLLTSLLSANPMPAVFIAADERIEFINEGAAKLFGSNLLDRHYITVLRQPALLDGIEESFRRNAPTLSTFLTTEAGREVTYRVKTAPVMGSGQQGVVVYFEDMTHVQDAVQQRRDFIANVSHELKTPLTALTGFIETLRGPARNDEAARDRFLEIMDRETRRMNRLVHDLLSLSRVESEERMRPTQRINIAETLTRAAALLKPLLDEAGAQIDLTLAETEVIVSADEDQLTQVFTNLIENAVKYGGRNVRLTLSVTEYATSLRGPAARIEVGDDGDGIESIHLPRLMERFYRVDGHRSREMGGTGLGLAIVKHIVNRHRGRVRITSETGVGSIFTVVLPLADEAR